MNTISTQQEILLLTGTSFSARCCYQEDEREALTETQQLEEACWNGMLRYMLPEICIQPAGKKMYLWQIKEAVSFIGLELGESPEEKENYFSIDPYSLMRTRSLS